jgi:thiosulfate dehydrogenase [quinone] large subunit
MAEYDTGHRARRNRNPTLPTYLHLSPNQLRTFIALFSWYYGQCNAVDSKESAVAYATTRGRAWTVEGDNKVRYVWAALRIALGWMFFWAFVDKVFGLGFATKPEEAWIAGGSPTAGYLAHGTTGLLAGLYQSLAGNPLVDWLFMLGLLGLGLSLLLGICVRIAGYGGVLFVLLLWSSNLPPAQNPIIDQHIIYAIVLVGLATVRAGQWVGLGKLWYNAVAKKYPILQ